MRSRRLLAFVSILTLGLVALAAPTTQAAGGKDRYIVVLKDSVNSPAVVAKKHGEKYGAEVKNVYKHALKGYSAKLKDEDVAALRSDPQVARVERDGIARISAPRSKGKPKGGSTPTYTFPSWGIDRIDQANLPLSGSYYLQGTGNGGGGVTVYVIDTGVRLTHEEFGNRTFSGYDYVSNDSDASDCNGHGTHVAGTIGGTKYGVAKNVKIVAVRVLDCGGSGYWSWVIAGINWVIGQHTGTQPAVINMSLGGGASSSVDTAVKNAVADGITVAVAAGNSNANACNYSPARVLDAVTVGATTSSDARASYSNYGSCLDLFAPGSSIKSAWSTGNTATNTISGTSMASPHVAGVAALYLKGDPSASPATVANALKGKATDGKVTGSGSNSPNKLLFTDY